MNRPQGNDSPRRPHVEARTGVWIAFRQSYCHVLLPFPRLLVSGCVFSMFSGSAGQKSLSLSFVFKKFSGSGVVRDADRMSFVASGLADSTIHAITLSITYNSLFVKQNPHHIAGVIHTWLRENSSRSPSRRTGFCASHSWRSLRRNARVAG